MIYSIAMCAFVNKWLRILILCLELEKEVVQPWIFCYTYGFAKCWIFEILLWTRFDDIGANGFVSDILVLLHIYSSRQYKNISTSKRVLPRVREYILQSNKYMFMHALQASKNSPWKEDCRKCLARKKPTPHPISLRMLRKLSLPTGHNVEPFLCTSFFFIQCWRCVVKARVEDNCVACLPVYNELRKIFSKHFKSWSVLVRVSFINVLSTQNLKFVVISLSKKSRVMFY